MRIMEGFHLRSIAGEMIAVPTGAVATKLSGLAILNETGQFLFELLHLIGLRHLGCVPALFLHLGIDLILKLQGLMKRR